MRLAPVKLARPGLKIYMPGSSEFLEDGRIIDVEHAYFMGHLSDGSIIEITDTPPEGSPEGKTTDPAGVAGGVGKKR